MPETSPDIICLQEVDHYEDFYKEQIKLMGYTSRIVWRKGTDIILTGWKSKKYTLAATKEINYDHLVRRYGLNGYLFKTGNVGLICLLQHNESQKYLVVVNTNMCEELELDYVKYAQGNWLMKCLSEFLKEL